jgi:hypothetical protein
MRNSIFIIALIVGYVVMCYGIVVKQIILFGMGELFILTVFALYVVLNRRNKNEK